MEFVVDQSLLQTCLERTYPRTAIALKSYIVAERTVEPGVNCTSRVLCVIVDYQRDGRCARESLAFKVPFSDRHFDAFRALGLYDRERYVYDAVLPRMARLTAVPTALRHFYTTDGGVLVLEDVTALGYRMDTDSLMDFARCRRVLEGLATFHAASVRLKQTDRHILAPLAPHSAETTTTSTSTHGHKLITALTASTYPILANALRRLNVPAAVRAKFAAYADRIRMADSTVATLEGGGVGGGGGHRFCVLNHGDVKRNNIFVRYDEGGRPTAVKLVDYQLAHWNSPICDLLYFAMTSARFSVFAERYDELLDVYLAALNATLSRLGCERSYTRDQYEADVQASKCYQVAVLILIGYYAIKEADDSRDRRPADKIDRLCDGDNFKYWFWPWFRYFVQRGYFD